MAEWFIPGAGFINETTDTEWMVPGGGFINEISGMEPINLYGTGISQSPGEFLPTLSIAGKAEGVAVGDSEGRLAAILSLCGESMQITYGEAAIGKFLMAYGWSEIVALSQAPASYVLRVLGQSRSEARADAYGRKTIDVELLADPNLLVRFRPHIGGGGVLTYRAGTPDAATYWDIVGVGADGFEEPPHGSLRWHYVRADKAGLAANIYISPINPALAGHRDRVVVRRADA